MIALRRPFVRLLAVAALFVALGCGKSEPTNSGPPDDSKRGSKGGPRGGTGVPVGTNAPVGTSR